MAGALEARCRTDAPRGRASTCRGVGILPRSEGCRRLLLALLAVTMWAGQVSAEALSIEDYWHPVGDNPQSFSASDCDGDGSPDLISANFDGNSSTVLRNPNGSLRYRATIGAPAQPSGATCADFTGDGIPDAAIASYAEGTVTIYAGVAGDGFAVKGSFGVGSQPRSVTAADLNLDGAVDLVIANAQSNDLTLLFGDGTGAFPFVSAARLPITDQTNRPRAARVADFNLDGIPDIVVASNGKPSLRLLLGDGLGFTFFEGVLPSPGKLLGVATADLNNDTIPDLATLGSDGTLSLFTGVGNGTFTFLASFPVRKTAKAVDLADFDGDGLVDVAISFSDTNSIQIVRAEGPGEFPSCGGPWRPFLCPSTVATNPLGRSVFRMGPEETPQILFLGQSPWSLNAMQLGDATALQTTPLAALPTEPDSFLLADLDNDATDDAIVTLKMSRTMSLLAVLRGTTDGGFDPIPPASSTCGNGVLEAGEVCDDGNLKAKDGCSPGCMPELERGALSVAAADLNQDVKQDLVVVDGKGNLRVLFGNGQRQFSSMAILGKVSRNTGAVLADFNGDGNVDIVTVPKSRRDGSLSVLLSDGTGQLIKTPVPGGKLTGPLLAGDFDRNGTIDLMAVQTSKPKGLVILSTDVNGTLRSTRFAAVVPRGITGLHAGDFNEDGWADIVAVQPKKPAYLFLGTPSGTFVATAGIDPSLPLAGVTIADLDGDQHQDVMSCSGLGACSTYYGDGAAHFVRVPFPVAPSIGRLAEGAVAGDLDGDGHVDLAGISRRDDRLVVHFGGPASGVLPSSVVLTTGSFPGALELADLNGDGHPDLIAANEGSQDVSIFTNLGARQFSTLARIKLPSGSAGFLGLAVADVNGDERLDLAVSQSQSRRVTVLINTGGGFAALGTYATGGEPRGVAIANMNGDGLLDIVTANRGDNTVSVLLSTGPAAYARTDVGSGGIRPWDVEAPDLNGDGRGDIVVVNELSSGNSAESSIVSLLNDGFGAFPAITATHVRGREFGTDICTGDFDGDGKADVAVASIYTGDVMLVHGAGNGGWNGDEREFPLGEAVSAVWCGDADGDGRSDVAFARRRSGDVGVILTGPQ